MSEEASTKYNLPPITKSIICGDWNWAGGVFSAGSAFAGHMKKHKKKKEEEN